MTVDEYYRSIYSSSNGSRPSHMTGTVSNVDIHKCILWDPQSLEPLLSVVLLAGVLSAGGLSAAQEELRGVLTGADTTAPGLASVRPREAGPPSAGRAPRRR
eukprot:9495496-Pyramimonas_sp.AAC.1